MKALRSQFPWVHCVCVFFGVFFFCLFCLFFPFIFISWRLITLQYCSGFCHTLTWISHGFTCIPHLESIVKPHWVTLCTLILAALGLLCCFSGLRWWRGEGATLQLQFTGFSSLWRLLLQSTVSGCMNSGAVAHGLRCSAACGTFPDQRSNPCLPCINRQILIHCPTREVSVCACCIA